MAVADRGDKNSGVPVSNESQRNPELGHLQWSKIGLQASRSRIAMPCTKKAKFSQATGLV